MFYNELIILRKKLDLCYDDKWKCQKDPILCQKREENDQVYKLQDFLIHSDVWGPSKIKKVTGKRWFITFIDNHSRNITALFKHI